MGLYPWSPPVPIPMNRHRFLASNAASEAFVRLFESSFGVTARAEGDEIVLGLAR